VEAGERSTMKRRECTLFKHTGNRVTCDEDAKDNEGGATKALQSTKGKAIKATKQLNYLSTSIYRGVPYPSHRRRERERKGGAQA
jgi:hypothetical protein